MKRRLITGKYVTPRCECTDGLEGHVTPAIGRATKEPMDRCPTCNFYPWVAGKDVAKVWEAREFLDKE